MGADGKNLTRGRAVGLAVAALLAAALSCAALARGCAPAPAPGSDAGSSPAAAAGPAARDGEAVMWQHLLEQIYERIRPASLNSTGLM